MRWPPRSTPGDRSDSLARLHGYLYPQGQHAIALDSAYRHQRSRGLAAAHVWIHRGACPHAVESTAAIVQAQQLDEQLLGTGENAPQMAHLEWPVRSSYAIAIIRFVNAIADEQQTGLYAQSIFAIAERIGLPVWFVELRHAATHEELPSLDVLRQASVAALGWLQVHFWRPAIARKEAILRHASGTLDDATHKTSIDVAEFDRILTRHADEIRGKLKSYKRLVRQVVGDASLRGQSRNAVKEAQKHVLQSGIRASKALSAQMPSTNPIAFIDISQAGYEASAILAEILVEPGFLVPETKSKRAVPQKGEFIASLSQPQEGIWLPLIDYLGKSLHDFSVALQETILDRIQAFQESDKQIDGYLYTLASWLVCLYASEGALFEPPSSRREDTSGWEKNYSENEDIADAAIAQAPLHLLHLARQCLANPNPISIALVRHLCAGHDALNRQIRPLLELAISNLGEDSNSKRPLGQSNTANGFIPSGDHSVDEMERAVLAMEEKLASLSKSRSPSMTPDTTTKRKASSESLHRTLKAKSRSDVQAQRTALCSMLPGWEIPDPTSFHPTPMGCLNGVVPELDLQEVLNHAAQ